MNSTFKLWIFWNVSAYPAFIYIWYLCQILIYDLFTIHFYYYFIIDILSFYNLINKGIINEK